MRQRLGIAQALINKPEVLFLDEPTSALDPLGRSEVLNTLIRLKSEATTVFLSSHILVDVERVCDAIAVINEGRLVIQSSIEDLRQRFARPVFELEVEESIETFIQKVEGLSWVATVETGIGENPNRARIISKDIVAESGLILRHYELLQPSLEEMFIELLKEEG
jgi:ABC-2 type transport system ATP-binding protein